MKEVTIESGTTYDKLTDEQTEVLDGVRNIIDGLQEMIDILREATE